MTTPASFLGTEDYTVRDANERQLRLIDAQGNLDNTVIQRIKDMKVEYERQINVLLKDKSMDNLKIETLAKKIQDNERAKTELVDKFKRDITDREGMKRQIDKLQDQVFNLEDELDRAKSMAEQGGRPGGPNGPPGIPLTQQIKGPSEREAINQ